MSHKPVSTAEKRTELKELGEPWPVCECHGLSMKWQMRNKLPSGGNWHCGERQRESQRRWYKKQVAFKTQWFKNQVKYKENHTQIRMFGQEITIPNDFKEVAVHLREQRKQQVKEIYG